MRIRLQVLIFLFAAYAAYGQDTTKINFLFVGDVMQHDSQIRAAFNPDSGAYDYSACFQFVKPVIQSADIAIANLEVTLAGPPYKGYPQFSAPDELAIGLKDAGFDVLVTANNHSLDRRKKGIERTIDVLDSLDIHHTGTFKDSVSRASSYPLIIEKNGFQFSLLNYTYGTNGIPITKPNIVNLIDTIQIKTDLAMARQQNTDAIIVFMHWGAEYQDKPNRSQKKIAEICFENGASLVIGSHPHVLQPMEWRKEKNQLVAYSLGNFVSGQQSRFRDGGGMLWVEFEKIQSDSVQQVQLTDATFELEWVYRNNESPKKYFILPLKEFENDTLLVNGKTAREMLATFAADSRKLLSNNVNINESKRDALETSYYEILLTTLPDSIILQDSSSLLRFYGLHADDKNDGHRRWTTGKFYDREVAERVLTEIIASTSFTNAEIVWYYWGRRRKELTSGK